MSSAGEHIGSFGCAPSSDVSRVKTDVWSAQSHPVEERNVIEQVRVGEGNHAQIFAELWTLVFRESGKRHKRRKL